MNLHNPKTSTPTILAIETATDACSVAIYKNQVITSRFVVQPQAHAKLLLSMVDEVCKEAGITLREMDLFAYGMGPGSFTGLRIAASAIQGLAFAMQKPVLGISSLQALAQQLLATDSGVKIEAQSTILPIFDARMQEVYWGQYVLSQQGAMQMQQADSLAAPVAVALDLKSDCIALGTGAIAYTDILQAQNPKLQIITDVVYPRAAEVAQLALIRYQNGDLGVPASQAMPVYIRDNVAQVGKKNPD